MGKQLRVRRRERGPGTQSKLRGALYSKGYDKNGYNSEQRVLLGTKDKNTLDIKDKILL